jgi:hypothetical protein
MGSQAVKLTPDTNVRVRGVVRDHPAQAEAANKILRNASLIAVALLTAQGEAALLLA